MRIRIYICKVPIDLVHPEELPTIVTNLRTAHKGSQIVFLRVWDLVMAHLSPSFLRVLNDATLVLPVSRMIQKMAHFLHYPKPWCYYPYDTIIRILTLLEETGASVFILGSRGSQIMDIEQKFRLTFPNIRLLGRYSGFFHSRIRGLISTAISKANPDILLSGTGINKLWVFHSKNSLNTGIQLWNREWFDIVLGKRHRPARSSVQHGREWIHEVLERPFKLLRILVIAPFWLHLLWWRLFVKK